MNKYIHSGINALFNGGTVTMLPPVLMVIDTLGFNTRVLIPFLGIPGCFIVGAIEEVRRLNRRALADPNAPTTKNEDARSPVFTQVIYQVGTIFELHTLREILSLSSFVGGNLLWVFEKKGVRDLTKRCLSYPIKIIVPNSRSSSPPLLTAQQTEALKDRPQDFVAISHEDMIPDSVSKQIVKMVFKPVILWTAGFLSAAQNPDISFVAQTCINTGFALAGLVTLAQGIPLPKEVPVGTGFKVAAARTTIRSLKWIRQEKYKNLGYLIMSADCCGSALSNFLVSQNLKGWQMLTYGIAATLIYSSGRWGGVVEMGQRVRQAWRSRRETQTYAIG